jgi:hypothetical protein
MIQKYELTPTALEKRQPTGCQRVIDAVRAGRVLRGDHEDLWLSGDDAYINRNTRQSLLDRGLVRPVTK